MAAIPTTTLESPPTYSFLLQMTRTNNAAPVATGRQKPVSQYGLERVEDRLRVIAHLSEPVDKYWLGDNTALQTFVQDELAYGAERRGGGPGAQRRRHPQ